MSGVEHKHHHLKNGRFRNNADINATHASAVNVLRWKKNSPRVKPMNFLEGKQPLGLNELSASYGNGAKDSCLWIGHATFLLRCGGLNILTDPHFSKRASPSQLVGPKRSTQPAVTIECLPHIDVVVISHDHYDHLDLESVKSIYKKQRSKPPLFVVPLGIGSWLSQRGILTWVELDWWESTEYRECTFDAVPVQHFSGRGLKPNNTLWAGFVIEFKNENEAPYKLFFAGDTGYCDDLKAIKERFGAMDLSLIPIGAYEPNWFMREVHVNPDEAVRIHLDVASKKSIGMHWGSFILTDEPMDEPPKKLEEAKKKYELAPQEFITVDHGERVLL